MMTNVVENDYKDIFKYFGEISQIPRESGNEQAISDYLVKFAKEHQLEYYQDKANNVIMIKEATTGYENEPAIILQGHMDMVCEKIKESSHDFLKDGIKLVVEGDYLHADGTTLGADNGIAVAYILSLFSDETLEHPRLEAIITTDEEVGLVGAKVVDISRLQGKYLINIDSEEEGHLLSSCAGGLRGTSVLPLKRVAGTGKKMKVSIGGLFGGHSGSDINKNRTNATKLIGRLLFELKETSTYGLIDLQGGFKDNVIPRDASAELFIEGTDNSELVEEYSHIKTNITELMEKYRVEIAASEPNFNYTVEDLGDDTYNVVHPVSFEKILFLLVHMPYGIQVMSSNIEGLVESSLNLGIFNMEEEKANFCNAVRSSVRSYKKYMSDCLEYAVTFLGGEYILGFDYPAWEYKKESALREHFQKIYKDLYGKEMKVEAIHAGLECGVISEKRTDLDMVSIGPDMQDVHTVEEKLNIPSTIRVYQFLEKIIKENIR